MITDGALRKIIRNHTSEPGVRQAARCIKTICRKVALGRETGDRTPGRERVTARDVGRWLGANAGDAEGLDRLHRRLDAPAIPAEVRAKGREVFERLSASGWTSTDPDYIRSREYLECLTHVPWRLRSDAKVDLARVRAKLDESHAGLEGVKEHLLDHVAVHVLHPKLPASALCLTGPEGGVGKTSLAHSLAGALGRVCAQVNCKELVDAEALLGDPRRGPGRILTELRRVGARNPVVVVDELDRLSERGDLPAAVLELFDSEQRASFRDRYLELPFDLSDVLLMASAARLRPVPSMLRERLKVVNVPRVHPGGEAGHRGRAPVAGAHPVERTRHRSCRGHRRGASIGDPRLRLGRWVVVSAGRARHVVPEGGAPPGRGRLVVRHTKIVG